MVVGDIKRKVVWANEKEKKSRLTWNYEHKVGIEKSYIMIITFMRF